MSHLSTVVRVRACDEDEAIEIVNALLEDCNYEGIFDYWDEGQTILSEEVKTEEDFANLRKKELEISEDYLEQAKSSNNVDWRGFYYRMAGECLQEQMFESVERLAYDYARYHDHEKPTDLKGGAIFFVETDRHY